MRKKPNIYLAGQITKNRWRRAISEDKFNGGWRISCETIGDVYDKEDYYYGYYETKRFLITGPHSISCDHSCYHLKGSKHASTDGCMGSLTQADVFKACIQQINYADFVFAYIESTTAHGTISEIGYAYGSNKPVFILFKTKRLAKELWFIAQMAKKTWIQGEGNQDDEVKKSFYESIEEFKKIKKTKKDYRDPYDW